MADDHSADTQEQARSARRGPPADPTVLEVRPGDPRSLTRDSRAELNRWQRHRRASGSLSPNPYNLTISHTHRFVWFRNAKVATRTVLAFLRDQHPDELLVLSAMPYPTAAFSEYFKFGFVRHPLDRFISAWQDKVCDRNHYNFQGEQAERMLTIENFASWVAEQDLRDLLVTDRHLILQSRLVDLTEADFVGRMESFAADFSEVCERIGLRWRDPEQRNRSAPSGVTSDNASQELRSIVEEAYRLDYQTLGY